MGMDQSKANAKYDNNNNNKYVYIIFRSKAVDKDFAFALLWYGRHTCVPFTFSQCSSQVYTKHIATKGKNIERRENYLVVPNGIFRIFIFSIPFHSNPTF